MRTLRQLARDAELVAQWSRVAARTVAYCSASVAARPVTGPAVPQKIMRRYFERLLAGLHVQVVAEGTRHLALHRPCIMVANHASLLDIPCIGVLCDFDYKWVSKKEIFEVPFVGWHLRACGHICVDRSRRDNTERLAAAFHDALRRGSSILMFPEGTRSDDGELRPLRRGAFVLAVRERVPVAPIVLDGTTDLLQKGSLRFDPRRHKRVRVRVLEPLTPALGGDEASRVRMLREQCRQAMLSGLASLRSSDSPA